VGLLRGCLEKGRIVERKITLLQGALVEKTQGGHAVLDTARNQILLVQRVDLITTNVFGTELFWRPAEILSKLLDRADVTTDRIGRIVATPEILQHALAKSCHRKTSFLRHGD
jgi:hypothetical protein